MCLVPGCREVPSKALCRQHAIDLERELPALIDLAEASRLLGYKYSTCYNKCSVGELPTARAEDGRPLYPTVVKRAEVVRYIANRLKGMSPAALTSYQRSVEAWMPLLTKNRTAATPPANQSRITTPTVVEQVAVEVTETVDLQTLTTISEPLYAIELLAQVLRGQEDLEIDSLDYRVGGPLRFTGKVRRREMVKS